MEPWIPLTLTVTTPMFLSPRPGGAAELRPPALRGAARFWFRALAAPVFEPAADHTALARAEAEIFGRPEGAPGSVRGDGPSRVAIRLRRPPTPTRADRERDQPDWLRSRPPGRATPGTDDERPDHGIGYLLGQAYFRPGPPPSLGCRSYFAPTSTAGPAATADIDLRVSPAAHSDRQPSVDYVREIAGISLWAAATFGGLGARTRRGFGGFSLAGLNALSTVLPASTITPDVPTRSHPAIRRLHELVRDRHRPGSAGEVRRSRDACPQLDAAR
ncbi:RAMP superfamily CRISPR-associated protein, partial [Frankia canadensis]|uniref:RAMP superfamily CRISPR-associated protein n=1 Tax=Frankia canadensis TaxID=1836972 RepID=UPI001A9C5E1F